MPIFCFDTMVAALASLRVPVEFVPDGEADAAVVSVAQRLGGYILGNDSDFVVLAAGADRVRGYIPTEGVQWVSRVGSKRRVALFPPTSLGACAVHTLVYPPPALAKHLGIPGSSLALLSSLVGNDYIGFEGFWDNVKAAKGDTGARDADKPYWRIQHAAAIMRTIPLPQLNDGADAVGYVRDVLAALRRRAPKDELVTNVITAMLQYVLPDVTPCCPAYPFCSDTACRARPRNQKLRASPEVEAYARAQRAGSLKPLTNLYMAPDRLYPWGLAEDPAFPSTRSAPASCRVRHEAYRAFLAAVRPSPEPQLVVEYDRTPDLRLEATDAAIPPGVPLCLWPVDQRIAIYAESLFGADVKQAIIALPAHMHPLAAALRMCATLPSGDSEQWTHADVYAIARAGLGSFVAFNAVHDDIHRMPNRALITARSVQRVAQFSSVLHDLHIWAQALLLDNSSGKDMSAHLAGWKFIDGPALHALLAGREPGARWVHPDESDVRRLVDAALLGVEVPQIGADIEPPHRQAVKAKATKAPVKEKVQGKAMSASARSVTTSPIVGSEGIGDAPQDQVKTKKERSRRKAKAKTKPEAEPEDGANGKAAPASTPTSTKPKKPKTAAPALNARSPQTPQVEGHRLGPVPTHIRRTTPSSSPAPEAAPASAPFQDTPTTPAPAQAPKKRAPRRGGGKAAESASALPARLGPVVAR
jgi:hypothetical protein